MPILIIVHHISLLGFNGIEFFEGLGDIVMYLFFAMSGYGLTISYINNANYINGFLSRSLTKLFIPYVIAVVIFFVYRYFKGVEQFELFKSGGLMSFVPTSWFIWILSLFYIFFFIVFKFLKTSTKNKVIITCCLVALYYLIAPKIGIEFWRYFRCPGFCVGMLFALGDRNIRQKFTRLQIIVVLSVACIIKMFGLVPIRAESLFWPTIMFMFFYLVKPIPENGVTKYLSGISLEMFIIQYIPIYILTDDFQSENTLVVVVGVLILDILLATLVHRVVLLVRPFFESKILIVNRL